MNSRFVRVLFVISVVALVLTACKAISRPTGERAPEKVARAPKEVPKRLTPEEEAALAQEMLGKEAKEEFDRLCEEADLLIAEKKFEEAIEVLLAYPDKFAQTEFGQRTEEKIAEIEKLQEEEEKQALTEEARLVAEELLEKADALVAEKKFSEALDLFKSYPTKYLETPSWYVVMQKMTEIVEKEQEEQQRVMREAQEEFEKRKAEAQGLAAENKFDAALALLSGYPQKFAHTEWKEKIQEIEADISERKKAYEEHLQFLREAREAAERVVSAARALSQEKKFAEALSALSGYPKEFADTEHAQQVAVEIEAVTKMKGAYEEEQRFLAAAEKECKNRMYEAKKLMEEHKYEEALKLLSEYPAEYSDTDWNTVVKKFSQQVVEPEKARYDAHQKFLQDAQTAYESAINNAEALTEAKRFDEAVSILTSFPEEYASLYSAQIEPKTKEILAKKEEYERRRVMVLVGAVIVGAVIVLGVIVLLVRRSSSTEQQ